LSRIFLSYRREDSAPYAGRVCDRLESAFGADHVFMDVDDIAPGADFVTAIEARVAACDVLVAVIGPKWLDTLRTRQAGQDFVHGEIAAALRRGVPVIPVLVGGGTLPSPQELPPELRRLARHQAVAIRDSAFDQDANGLIAGIRRLAKSASSPNRLIWMIVAAGIILSLAGTAVFLTISRSRASLNGTWIARMQYEGQRPFYVRLHLAVTGNTLNGTVEYPTGTGTIESGSVDHGRLAFSTRHLPQFEQQPAKVSFTGRQRGLELELTSISPDGGIARGTARKVQ
jgi:hypothetical protein